MANNTYHVERSIAVDAPPERIYEQVEDFHRWRTWSPWEDLDPDLDRTYSGPSSGKGASYAWSGNRKAGQGSMTIVEADKPETVRIDLRFDKPFKARNDMRMTIQSDGQGSRVVWSRRGEQTFMLKLFGIFKSMDDLVGPDFEKGLRQLKHLAESSP